MSLLDTFVSDLKNYLIGRREIDSNIIGLHTKKLDQVGDIRFPLNFSNWCHLLTASGSTGYCNNIFDYNRPKENLDVQIEQLRTESLKWQIEIDKVIISNKLTHVDIFLSRTADLFKSALTTVLEAGNDYGSSDIINNKVNVELYPNHSFNSESNLSSLRLHLLKEVTTNLLKSSSSVITNKESVITLSLQPVDDGSQNIICGPVLSEKGTRNLTTVQQLYKKRASDMRMMAEHKYRFHIKLAYSWETYFDNLGKACVTIEMMSNKPQKAIKVTQNDLQAAHKGPCFIFYNCARLSALFREFENMISNKVYSELPEIENVDFSLLTQQEEWELFYVYILQYPIVVKNCIKHIEKGIVNPQYLVTFLSNLTSVFSVYYRRVRILTSPREHMFAVIHARIYLLKAIQCVFHNALGLLDIKPIKEM